MDMPAASHVSSIFKVFQRNGPSGLSLCSAADFLRELGQFLWSPCVSVIHVRHIWTLQHAVRIIILHSIRGSDMVIQAEWEKSGLQKPGVLYYLSIFKACIFLANYNCHKNFTLHTLWYGILSQGTSVYMLKALTSVDTIGFLYHQRHLLKAAPFLSDPQAGVNNLESCHYYLCYFIKIQVKLYL